MSDHAGRNLDGGGRTVALRDPWWLPDAFHGIDRGPHFGDGTFELAVRVNVIRWYVPPAPPTSSGRAGSERDLYTNRRSVQLLWL